MRSLGASIHLAENGQEALEAAKEKDFHLALMDCQMPILDGLQATRSIREWELSEGLKSEDRLVIVA